MHDIRVLSSGDVSIGRPCQNQDPVSDEAARHPWQFNQSTGLRALTKTKYYYEGVLALEKKNA